MLFIVLILLALIFIVTVSYVAIEEFCAENLEAYKKRADAKYALKQEELRCIRLMAEYQELQNEQMRISGSSQFLPTRTNRRR